MYEEAQNGEIRQPRCKYYVSNSNGGVYPALRNIPGYEDDNPADWRPATAAEVEAYLDGAESTLAVPRGVADLSAPAQVAVPTVIQLAEDDPPQLPAADAAAVGAIPSAPPAFAMPTAPGFPLEQ